MNPIETAKAAASAAIAQRSWIPFQPEHRWENELATGRSPEEQCELSVWGDEDGNFVEPPICSVASYPTESGESKLWVRGLPWPAQVPDLLEWYADLLLPGLGSRVLDLATGEVIPIDPAVGRKLEEDPKARHEPLPVPDLRAVEELPEVSLTDRLVGLAEVARLQEEEGWKVIQGSPYSEGD